MIPSFRVLVITAGLTFAACKPAATPPSTVVCPRGSPFALHDVALDKALPLVSSSFRVTIVVAPDAAEVAHRARVSLFSSGSAADTVGRLLAEALRPEGLMLSIGADGWIVRRNDDIPEPRCRAFASVEEARAKQPERAEREALERERRLTEVLASIRERSPTEREVSTHARELFMEDLPNMLRHGMLVATVRDGKRAVVVESLEPGSLLERLGLRTGDLVLEVSGHDVSAPTEALAAYTAARDAPSIPIIVERGGKRMTLWVYILP